MLVGARVRAAPRSTLAFHSSRSAFHRKLVCIPPNFGGRDGPAIQNKAEVLPAVDAALGTHRPPDLEVLLTDHVAPVGSRWARLAHVVLLRFGHVAVRYTTSDGVQRVMNIMGDLDRADSAMVNFVPPAEYLYGTAGFDTFSQQGGAYNRPIVGVRVERVAGGAIDALHAFYSALDLRSRVEGGAGAPGSAGRGAARFQLIEVRLSALMAHAPPAASVLLRRALGLLGTLHVRREDGPEEAAREAPASAGGTAARGTGGAVRALDEVRAATFASGNCAQWSSSGLQFAGLLRRPSLFPKRILVELLEDEALRHGRSSNVNVVYYEQVEHAAPRDPEYGFLAPAFVHPLLPVRNWVFSDMRRFASATVSVPAGGSTAVVRRRPSASVRRPPSWMPYWNGLTLAVPSAVLVGMVDHVGPIGPMAAAAWLGFRWWLY